MIAWVSHHLPQFYGDSFIGGAEITDLRYLEAAPVEVVPILPDEWQTAMDYDKVIITGTDLLSNRAMMELSKKKPVVMVHHKQTRTPARQHLLSSASTLICHTPRHLEIELEWTQPKSSKWILSSHDPEWFEIQEKENFALWAARMHQQKGPEQALKWSTDNDIPLLMYSQEPKTKVLETMSRAKHFVFFPQDFDAEPRTIIEAVMSGCQIHTNDNAGITSIPNWDDRETIEKLITTSRQEFWETALA
jgi:hypothetical protein